jgi:hypothetical protein
VSEEVAPPRGEAFAKMTTELTDTLKRAEDKNAEDGLRAEAHCWPQPADRYKHYKGGEYEVLMSGILDRDSSPTGESCACVVYRSLEPEDHLPRVRTLANWAEMVRWFEGTPQERVWPRFLKLEQT